MFEQHRAEAAQLSPEEDDYVAQMKRAHSMYHRDWLAFNETRHRLRLAWAEFFRDYDLLLCPTATTAAFPHNQQGERWERMITVNGNPQPGKTQLF